MSKMKTHMMDLQEQTEQEAADAAMKHPNATPVKKPFIIGIVGLARSGKDTVASIIENELTSIRMALAEPIYKAMEILDPYIGINVIRFGDTPIVTDAEMIQLSELKREGMTIEDIKGIDEEGVFRGLLQRMGDALKAIDDDVKMREDDDEKGLLLMNYLDDRLYAHFGNGPVTESVIVTDVRTTEEAEFVRDVFDWWVDRPNTYLIKVTRPAPAPKDDDIIEGEVLSDQEREFLDMPKAEPHVTERGIDPDIQCYEIENDGTLEDLKFKVLGVLADIIVDNDNTTVE